MPESQKDETEPGECNHYRSRLTLHIRDATWDDPGQLRVPALCRECGAELTLTYLNTDVEREGADQ